MRNPLLAPLAGILLLNASVLAAAGAEDSGGVSAAAGGSSFTAAAGMELVAVPGGCFRMGDASGDGEPDERPVHEVCVDGFSMGKYSVTVGEFERFVKAAGYRTEAERGGGCFTVGSNWKWSRNPAANWREPGFPQTDRHPVVCVSWDDALEFTRWLGRQEGRAYRLPTEAEWEYAARGGTGGRNSWGDRWEDACTYANVNDRTAGRSELPRVTTHDCEDGYLYTAPVGSFRPNSFGLYDMMGNVWQWTGDWYGEGYYSESPRNNPQGPPSGSRRVPRGGSWRSSVEHLRVALRVHPPSPSAGVGFRLLSPRAASPPAPVPKTGQTSCSGPTRMSPAVVVCVGTGQDGDTRTGVAWPEPRFADNGDQTITDTLTGLIWTGDANPAGGTRTWQEALDYVKDLNGGNHLGKSDWRLPNVNELESLVNKQADLDAWLRTQGFRNVQVDYYWTSSTYAGYPSYAWSVGTFGGIVAGRDKGDGYFVWPVRQGGPGAVSLPRTGQTACHDGSGTAISCAGTGQDGELQSGLAWPSPRFGENDDGIMTDRLTGLAWSKNGVTPGPAACRAGTRRTLPEALDLVGCLNANGFLGRRDWRLPNRNELATLVNRGEADSAAWLSSLGFAHVEPSNYWSSSSFVYATWNGWTVNLHDGAVTTCPKTHVSGVWPVRGGE